MFRYVPGTTVAHRLDPRTKLALQGGFVAAAYAHTEPVPLVILSVITLGFLVLADMHPSSTLYQLRYVIVFLAIAPILGALQLGTPWIDPQGAVEPGLASYRVLLIVTLGTIYLRTTSIRTSQAAVQWLLPGKLGRLLGIGVGLVVRFLPLLQADIRRVRQAMGMRQGDALPFRRRVRLMAVVVLERALQRADRLAVALRMRCLAWNSTLPSLSFSRIDAPALLGAALLFTTVWL